MGLALRRVRLLLVEDDADDALILDRVLARHPTVLFDTTRVGRLSEVQPALGQGSWDAIILDLWLPDAAGVDTVSQARVLAPAVPIVVISGLDDPDAVGQTIARGAQAFLAKGNLDPVALGQPILDAIDRFPAGPPT